MDNFFTLLEILSLLYIGYKIGEAVTMVKMFNLYEKITGKELEVEDIEAHFQEKLKEYAQGVMFETETINDVIYLYSHDKVNFICQANTLEEICKKCIECTKLSDVFVFHNEVSYHYNGKIIEKIEKE
jgi:hypothetical protein